MTTLRGGQSKPSTAHWRIFAVWVVLILASLAVWAVVALAIIRYGWIAAVAAIVVLVAIAEVVWDGLE